MIKTKAYKVTAPDCTLMAIWVKLGYSDELVILDNESVNDGPVSLTVGTEWDDEDLDQDLRTSVAQMYAELETDEYEEAWYAIRYEEVFNENM